MNRVGLKDYLLNRADDNDLLDCAKAWDAANEYGQFDTYSSVEEAAQANGWDAAQALSEARRVNQDADFFRFNGYGHLETKQRIEFDAEQGDDFGEVSKYLGEFFNSGSVNQSEKINDSWGNSILVKGGNGRYDGPRGRITVYENFEEAVDTSPNWHGGDNIFADCEIDEIWDENGSLFVTGAHHDGRACGSRRMAGSIYRRPASRRWGSSTERATRTRSSMTCGTTPRCAPSRGGPRRWAVPRLRNTSWNMMA